MTCRAAQRPDRAKGKKTRLSAEGEGQKPFQGASLAPPPALQEEEAITPRLPGGYPLGLVPSGGIVFIAIRRPALLVSMLLRLVVCAAGLTWLQGASPAHKLHPPSQQVAPPTQAPPGLPPKQGQAAPLKEPPLATPQEPAQEHSSPEEGEKTQNYLRDRADALLAAGQKLWLLGQEGRLARPLFSQYARCMALAHMLGLVACYTGGREEFPYNWLAFSSRLNGVGALLLTWRFRDAGLRAYLPLLSFLGSVLTLALMALAWLSCRYDWFSNTFFHSLFTPILVVGWSNLCFTHTLWGWGLREAQEEKSKATPQPSSLEELEQPGETPARQT